MTNVALFMPAIPTIEIFPLPSSLLIKQNNNFKNPRYLFFLLFFFIVLYEIDSLFRLSAENPTQDLPSTRISTIKISTTEHLSIISYHIILH